jgi:hypothetical protein
MAKEKSTKKKPAKRKSAGRKKALRKKKTIRRKGLTQSRDASGSSSAQIHQGVGAETATESETTPEIPDTAAEYGGES